MRKAKPKKRILLPDPKFNDVAVTRFVNNLMLDGKKSIAYTIFYDSLEIVGKNLNKQGRVIQHACVIAAKKGRTDLIPLIERWGKDEREGVRVAAAYALEKLAP